MNRLKSFPIDLEGCAFIHLSKQNCIAVVGNLYQEGGNPTEENTLIIYNLSTLRQLRRVNFDDTSDSGLYYCSKRHFLGRYANKELYLLDPRRPTKPLATLKHDYDVAVVDFPDNGDIICTADKIAYVYIWDPVSHINLKKIKLQRTNLKSPSYDLYYIADKSLILTLQQSHFEMLSIEASKPVYEQNIPSKESKNSALFYLAKTGEMLWVYEKKQSTKFLKYKINVQDQKTSLEFIDELMLPFNLDVETLEFGSDQILWNTQNHKDCIFWMDPYSFGFKLLEISKYKEQPNFEERDTVLFEIGKFMLLFEQDSPKVYILQEDKRQQPKLALTPMIL